MPAATDRCPLPVLAVSLVFGLGTVSVLFSGASGYVFPFFGIILKGIPGFVIALIMSVMSGTLAWGMYRLRPWSWWSTLGVVVTFSISSAISFTQIELMDLYREMDMPEEQLEMIERMGVLNNTNFLAMTATTTVLFLIYLVWIRRYFAGVDAENAELTDA